MAHSLVMAHAMLLYGAIFDIKLSVIPGGAAIFFLGWFSFPTLLDWIHFSMVIDMCDIDVDWNYFRRFVITRNMHIVYMLVITRSVGCYN